jgi:hypothetical protein
MQIMKSIISKLAKNKEAAADGEWIEIKNSLEELEHIEYVQAVKDSLQVHLIYK